MVDYRVGQGYDIHRLSRGRKLKLGGVEINNEFGLDGHSDADVVCHAIMDALLGAAALGDIGLHFPNTDPNYKDADSMRLMAHIKDMLEANGYAIANIDITILAEKPKLSPYMPQMQDNIAGVFDIEHDAVSIKATTNEMMGAIGRGEGIAALAVALIYK